MGNGEGQLDGEASALGVADPRFEASTNSKPAAVGATHPLAVTAAIYITLHTLLCQAGLWGLDALGQQQAGIDRRLIQITLAGVSLLPFIFVPLTATRTIATLGCLAITVVWLPVWLIGFVFGLIAGGLPALAISLPIACSAMATYSLWKLVAIHWIQARTRQADTA